MNASSYENTLAFVHALNRKPRKAGILEQLYRMVSSIGESVRAADEYRVLTQRGVAPEKAVCSVFERIKR